MLIPNLEWIGAPPRGVLRLLDQRALPGREVWLERTDPEAVFEDIRTLAVRGAPAIGVAAAFAVVLGVQGHAGGDLAFLRREAARCAERLRASRPTAVNLFWALDRMVRRSRALTDAGRFAAGLLEEASAILAEDRETCRRIGAFGAPRVPDGGGVITHCNAGGLATTGLGTALGVLFAAHEAGKRFTVYADETRPLLQGARLTVWELQRAGIEVILQCDAAAATTLRAGRVQMAVVGADRIAANGDTANKVGTYPLAVLCREHGVDFYVAAPASTFDLSLADGSGIPIEERDAAEVTAFQGAPAAPAGTRAFNPAFDVTPAGLITGIITEFGIIERPDAEKVRSAIAPAGREETAMGGCP